ncbi:uncharacterized protein MONBRDRAFT_12106 [Monosiga brevicollis MX1]|uniref:Ubiquitin-like domain-containing protein n=1 Tax=Monosiga brevicollis TaxID=81824 RepID=A9VB86_MONBE|nr:uncharacterized protein MONBRDRAFT_12106 [Monosiga brevicollis MX1]EDQ85144.1 predicted protein [Monosiga brevicollis MX1]|eukprot:XP_001749969.1 hypothetical protein [Monosiga brevicollis MX1]
MSIVTLNVSCSSANVRSERRFDKGLTISNVKSKLELIVGVPTASMQLHLLDQQGQKICIMSDDNAMLGAYPVEDYLELHVKNVDSTAAVGEFDDLSKVEKYELTDAEYASKRDTVLDFKRRNQLGRFNPEAARAVGAAPHDATQLPYTPNNFQLPIACSYNAAPQAEVKQQEEDANAAAMDVGSRCQVTLKSAGKQRGTVRYVDDAFTYK